MSALERLVLAPDEVTRRWVTDSRTTVLVSDGGAYRWLLDERAPTVAVLFRPPATASEIEATVAERRRRSAFRAVFVNEPQLIDERLSMLRSGFDEALASDVDTSELSGRMSLLVEAVRGDDGSAQPIPVARDVQLDPAAHQLRVRGRGIHLRPRESALLEVLAREPGRTFTRQQLLEAMGAHVTEDRMRTIDVHVRWLREKLERERADSVHLITVRGQGYRLEPR